MAATHCKVVHLRIGWEALALQRLQFFATIDCLQDNASDHLTCAVLIEAVELPGDLTAVRKKYGLHRTVCLALERLQVAGVELLVHGDMRVVIRCIVLSIDLEDQ